MWTIVFSWFECKQLLSSTVCFTSVYPKHPYFIINIPLSHSHSHSVFKHGHTIISSCCVVFQSNCWVSVIGNFYKNWWCRWKVFHWFYLHAQVGDDTFGRSTLQNFKDNSVNAGHMSYCYLFQYWNWVCIAHKMTLLCLDSLSLKLYDNFNTSWIPFLLHYIQALYTLWPFCAFFSLLHWYVVLKC